MPYYTQDFKGPRRTEFCQTRRKGEKKSHRHHVFLHTPSHFCVSWLKTNNRLCRSLMRRLSSIFHLIQYQANGTKKKREPASMFTFDVETSSPTLRLWWETAFIKAPTSKMNLRIHLQTSRSWKAGFLHFGEWTQKKKFMNSWLAFHRTPMSYSCFHLCFRHAREEFHNGQLFPLWRKESFN